MKSQVSSAKILITVRISHFILVKILTVSATACEVSVAQLIPFFLYDKHCRVVKLWTKYWIQLHQPGADKKEKQTKCSFNQHRLNDPSVGTLGDEPRDNDSNEKEYRAESHKRYPRSCHDSD